jgi:hypothetical protein
VHLVPTLSSRLKSLDSAQRILTCVLVNVVDTMLSNIYIVRQSRLGVLIWTFRAKRAACHFHCHARSRCLEVDTSEKDLE